MGWRPMVRTGSDPKWYGNTVVMATEEEARLSAEELMWWVMSRWLLVVDTNTEYTDAPVNYKFIDGQSVRIKDEDTSISND
jgi:hypothetical protein